MCLQNCTPLVRSELKCWVGFFFVVFYFDFNPLPPLSAQSIQGAYSNVDHLYLDMFLKVSFKLQKLYILGKLQTIQKRVWGNFPVSALLAIIHSPEKTTVNS